jgi:DNA-binding PadR family transcriptional regulator
MVAFSYETGGNGMKSQHSSESLAYHAARLLILISICGRPQNRNAVLPGIQGRMLLAKLDFFLRYPSYLLKAHSILEREHPARSIQKNEIEAPDTIESHMIRYRYGPWDHQYYPVLAYLVGKGLIEIEIQKNVEVFRITARGTEIAARINADATYADFVQRARLVWDLFHNFNGSRLKDFIYNHFPEVVAREIGGTI